MVEQDTLSYLGELLRRAEATKFIYSKLVSFRYLDLGMARVQPLDMPGKQFVATESRLDRE